VEDWLKSLVPWGTEILVRIQALKLSGLDPIWYFFTWLGYAEFYLIVLPLIYWCIHKEIGAALGYLAMLASWTADAIKYTFNIPRPSDPRLVIKWPEKTPSFLSGHTVSAVANWGFLAVRFNRPLLWVVAIIAMLGIPLSRMFLGVHFPQDIIGGYVVGFILLIAFLKAEPVVARWAAARPVPVQLVLAVAFPLLLIFIHPSVPDAGYPGAIAVTTMAALTGMGVGLVMERALVNFSVQGPLLQRVLRLVLGLLLVLIIYAGPGLILPAGLPYRLQLLITYVRYGLVGWTMTFFAPWLFVKVGLAQRERRSGALPGAGDAAVQPDQAR
jgi:membrane-associated phospholipid phosphatase